MINTNNDFKKEIASGKRFKFGENWKSYLGTLTDQKILEAEESLKITIGIENLKGKTFLDIGSGSGLFSLAAWRLGAKVFSFDFDPTSVSCTATLREQYCNDPVTWKITTGSVLDDVFIESIGQFDIVYSWGVLHHTGNMWHALDNAKRTVVPGGILFIALYNYQPVASWYWTWIKKCYNKVYFMRPVLIALHLVYPVIPSMVTRAIKGKKFPRGMSFWYDLLDWLGGYPFEVSSPHEIFEYFKKSNYELEMLKTVNGRHGCNEFIFKKNF
ncbi:class I SAM-dependent methyltransferase [Polynucleobacter paneuropaeus]|nr:class I SAM-dependent methyltransferase [Polynucleobacter paneuropaeus]